MKKGARNALVWLLIGALLSGCKPAQVQSEATSTQKGANTLITQVTQTPTGIPTSTPSPTATETPPPLPTFTPTPALTPTPTLSPSPTPPGYYENPQIGFSLILPEGWLASELTPYQEQFSNKGLGITLVVQSSDNTDNLSENDVLDKMITLYQAPQTKLITDTTLGRKTEITLGDGTKATQEEIKGKLLGIVDGSVRIAVASRGNRIYIFSLSGIGTSLMDNEEVLTTLYDSIHLQDIDSQPTRTGSDGG
jgi:hypothetical protein